MTSADVYFSDSESSDIDYDYNKDAGSSAATTEELANITLRDNISRKSKTCRYEHYGKTQNRHFTWCDKRMKSILNAMPLWNSLSTCDRPFSMTKGFRRSLVDFTAQITI